MCGRCWKTADSRLPEPDLGNRLFVRGFLRYCLLSYSPKIFRSFEQELGMKRLHGAMAVATFLAFSLGASTVYTQQRGGGGRQGGPPTYRLWWAEKAKPGQYGTNKPHIKLVDLKARHAGHPNWMEVVVNDENWHAEYNQGAPGFKIDPRMRPDTREFFAVIEGQMRFTLEGQPAPIVATSDLDRQHSEEDGVLHGSDRRCARALGGRQSAELQDALSGG